MYVIKLSDEWFLQINAFIASLSALFYSVTGHIKIPSPKMAIPK